MSITGKRAFSIAVLRRPQHAARLIVRNVERLRFPVRLRKHREVEPMLGNGSGVSG